jgi:flagellar basal-body rod protein FlgF
MDRLIYVAMSGARQVEEALAVTAHNLANAATPGFRADLASFLSLPLRGPGLPERIYALGGDAGVDFSAGPIATTGRDLDIAVNGRGWIVVQAPDGSEACSRRGDLRIGPGGMLEDGAGRPVLGNAGPITVPEHEKLEIGADGTLSIRPLGQSAAALAVVDRIRLVSPDPPRLEKRADGLLHVRDGGRLDPDPQVQIVAGALEGSNVNAVEALVGLIELSRSFELQVRIMRDMGDNEAASAQMMRLG